MIQIPDLREKVIGGCSHTVILGAGASIALQLAGGLRGSKAMPAMRDFVKKLNLQPMLKKHGIIYRNQNFEKLFSKLWLERQKHAALLKDLEAAIRHWFLALNLAHEPTIYDYLILGLREKDCIATFNWDPLLVQAAQRCNKKIKSTPLICFLHGNVIFSIDYKNKTISSIYSQPDWTPGPILFPVQEKDYNSDEVIADQWKPFLAFLKSSKIVTIFGYSAPKTDVAAISAMKQAWGKIDDRNFEQFEFIDIQPEEALLKTWKPFVHSHHYSYHKDFFDSSIAKFPRRSGEDYFTRNLEAIPTRPMPAPRNCSLAELIDWHYELELIEKRELSKS